MDDAPRTAGHDDTRTDTRQDRYDTRVPPAIAEIIRIGQILTQYGYILLYHIEPPVRWLGFATIARFFGTATLIHIAARLLRGLMRIEALEDMLFQRAQSGRDLVYLAPRASRPRAIPADIPPPGQGQPRAARPAEPPLTPLTLPTPEEIRAEVNRRSIGHTLAAICLDLGISPSVCTGPFWNRIFNAIQAYRGSLTTVVTELHRREKQFDALDWKHPSLPWPERTRDGIHRALGFFIGDPFPPPPAATAGPS